jgi:SAM-dependent methyltransferase
MMWFDQNNPDVLFCDNRTVSDILCDGRKLEVNPDQIVDFRKMPFADGSFHLVVFDPPHLHKLGQDTWMAQKYGRLLPSWKDDIREGFNECMRVLQPNGVLVFKWNVIQVKLSDVLDAIGTRPLFGHTSGKHGKTIWMAFMKPAAIATIQPVTPELP